MKLCEVLVVNLGWLGREKSWVQKVRRWGTRV
jgi:hypothetical protein